MFELLRPLLGVSVLVAAGIVLERVLVLDLPSFSRWPFRVLTGLVALHLYRMSPALLAVVTLVGWQTRPRRSAASGRSGDSPEEEAIRPREAIDVPAVIVVVALAVVILGRLPVTLYWDELVWLAKARIESTTPGSLVPEVLRPGSAIIPPGYPVFEPLAVSALSGWATSTGGLVVGAELLTLLCAAVFALLALERTRSAPRERFELGIAAVMALTPLVLVHLRSAYVDLEIGLLAGSLLLLLETGRPRMAALVALAMVGMKDEGAAHVLAITAAAALPRWRAGGGWRSRDVLGMAAAAAIGLSSLGAWKFLLARHEVVDADHAFGRLVLSRAPLVLWTALVQASDILAWGPLWAATAGLAIVALFAPARVGPDTRVRLSVLGLQAVALLGALLVGPERVIDFLRAGTLLPRVLVQLAPTAMLALAAGLAPASPVSATASDA